MSAKFDALYDIHVENFGQDRTLSEGVRICRLFTNLNNILSIDAIDRGTVFSFKSSIDDRLLLNIYVEDICDRIEYEFDLEVREHDSL